MNRFHLEFLFLFSFNDQSSIFSKDSLLKQFWTSSENGWFSVTMWWRLFQNADDTIEDKVQYS